MLFSLFSFKCTPIRLSYTHLQYTPLIFNMSNKNMLSIITQNIKKLIFLKNDDNLQSKKQSRAELHHKHS